MSFYHLGSEPPYDKLVALCFPHNWASYSSLLSFYGWLGGLRMFPKWIPIKILLGWNEIGGIPRIQRYLTCSLCSQSVLHTWQACHRHFPTLYFQLCLWTTCRPSFDRWRLSLLDQMAWSCSVKDPFRHKRSYKRCHPALFLYGCSLSSKPWSLRDQGQM